VKMVQGEMQINSRRPGYVMKNDFSTAEVISCPAFIDLMRRHVGKLLPYEIFYCSFGCLNDVELRVLKMMHDHFPLEYFNDLALPDGRFFSPLVNKWHANRRAVFFQGDRDAEHYPNEWVSIFNKHNLKNMIAHGKADIASGFFSSFSFYRLSTTVTEWHAEVMELLVPHLHDALLTAMGPSFLDECTRVDLSSPLTAEQQRIFYWMQQGKTDWETSRILGLNERTVKYHVKRILTKLNATNRTHAIGKVLDSRPLVKIG
jgi:DNA-binding CsgD family transcriptional regulator